DMNPWWTGKPCEHTQKSHINMCVYDSTWEASEAYVLDNHPKVEAWAKNDHLGFVIYYIFRGVVYRYFPDFIIKLTNGEQLILETKGQDTQKDKTKREFLDEWVQVVNEQGGFGRWHWAVSKAPSEIYEILSQYD
ncbi:MAG: type III restriction endonuclease subunit R, partial [candidate division Zixibacteria bacterium]|nr:type III restriction endonuclease subunit R [candidate division Zixibacteria bacterium]NIV08800.1 type III restriction endonuclease subunit R [candidate division Zixibacteria bacterium]